MSANDDTTPCMESGTVHCHHGIFFTHKSFTFSYLVINFVASLTGYFHTALLCDVTDVHEMLGVYEYYHHYYFVLL